MDILEPVWKGFITGLLFTLSFGTVFFSLIQTSIKRGVKKATFIALGVVCSDTLFIAIALFGSSFFTDAIKQYDHAIRIVGFIFLSSLGIHSIIKKAAFTGSDELVQVPGNWLFAAKGFMLNSINPMLLFSWIAVATYVESVDAFSFEQTLVYFTIALMMMFVNMLIISYYAAKLRNWLSEENVHRINIASGLLFIGFGVAILWPVTGLRLF